MFEERCTLCGGKLDSGKICKECGLNNNKSEKNYKVNRGSCDGKPMTHVHEEKEIAQPPKKPTVHRPQSEQKIPKQTYRSTGLDKPDHRKKKTGWISKVVTAFVFLSVAGTVIGSLSEMDIPNSIMSEEDDDFLDPYEMLEESGDKLPGQGESAEFELTSGKYIVGVHIPAGNYSADISYEFDSIRVDDKEHDIFLYEYPGKEGEDYSDDLRLFDGALVEITAEESIVLTTKNAQSVQNEENPLTQSYEFEGDTKKIAGVDFEPGVYDIYRKEGNGMVGIGVNENADEESEEDYELNDYMINHIYIGDNITKGKGYKNVIIPEGARLIMEDESYDEERFIIILRPSPQIASTDYLQTYIDHY